GLGEDVAVLAQRVDASASVADVQGWLLDLAVDVQAGLDERATQGQIAQLTDNVEASMAEQASLGLQMHELSEAVASFVSTADMDVALAEMMAAFESMVGERASQDDLNGAFARIGDLADEVEIALDDVQGQMNALQTQIDGLQTELSDKASTAEAKVLGDRQSATESRVAQLEELVAAMVPPAPSGQGSGSGFEVSREQWESTLAQVESLRTALCAMAAASQPNQVSDTVKATCGMGN
ncbi:MAG: hypothetical protein KGN78_14880, partial [Actinomycetales bacterium]|nr:hypothetical protein [Actinomycetales bacterium]